jgi:MinD-like ATPase involved in chromosome partitioning or flagellar assembly
VNGTPPRWFGYFNVKGGGGKSTGAFATAIAASQCGLQVGVVDGDPSGWLSSALGVLGHPVGLAEVLTGQAKVHDALAISHLGVAVLVGSRSLYHVGMSHEALADLRQQLDPLFEVVIADSQGGENRAPAMMRVCDRIIIPTSLDRVSAIVTTDTLRLAAEAGALDRVGGLLAAIVKLRKGEPEQSEAREVYANMRLIDIAYETIFPISGQWKTATDLAALPPQRLLDAVAMPLWREVQARRADPDRLKIWMQAYSRERRDQELREARGGER